MRKAFHLEKEVEVVATDEGILIRNPRYVLIDKEEYEDLKERRTR